tara:strand:+ start:358 stop:1332 length:975 start_codon:yes stop_codon:yes gene_type:complete
MNVNATATVTDQRSPLKSPPFALTPKSVLTLFDKAWTAHYQTSYVGARGRDAKIASELIKHWAEMSGTTFCAAVARYLADPDPYLTERKHPFDQFAGGTKINRYRVAPPVAPPDTRDPNRQAFDAAFDQLALATRLNTARGGGGPDQRAIFFAAMSDLPITAVIEAATTLTRTARFFPTVAEWAAEAERRVSALPSSPSAPLTARHPYATPDRLASLQAAQAACVASLRKDPTLARLATAIEGLPLRVPAAAHCSRCFDGGWASFTCRAGARCGRFECETAAPDANHDWCTRCACIPTNPNIQKRYEAMAHTRTTRGLAWKGSR